MHMWMCAVEPPAMSCSRPTRAQDDSTPGSPAPIPTPCTKPSPNPLEAAGLNVGPDVAAARPGNSARRTPCTVRQRPSSSMSMHQRTQAGSHPTLYPVRPQDAGSHKPVGAFRGPYTPQPFPPRSAPPPGRLPHPRFARHRQPSFPQPDYPAPRNQPAPLMPHARAMLRDRPPASPEPTQPGRRADEREEPLSCSPPLNYRIASTPAPA